MASAWRDLLPVQTLTYAQPPLMAASYRPEKEPQPYVHRLAAGGWPDVTTSSYTTDASGERDWMRANEGRNPLTISPLADRDGYTGSIPPGAGVRLPPIAFADTQANAKKKAKGKGVQSGGPAGLTGSGKAPKARSWSVIGRKRQL